MIIDITLNDKAWEENLPDYQNLIQTIIQSCAQKLDINSCKQQELSVLLTNDNDVQELNRNHRGKDKPTNILSFPADEDDHFGDLALAFETIDGEAREQSKSLQNHFTHLIIHGFLHLIGHDHENEKEAIIMEKLEVEILQELGIKNPYIT